MTLFRRIEVKPGVLVEPTNGRAALLVVREERAELDEQALRRLLEAVAEALE